MKKFLSWKIVSIIVITLILGFFDLPAQTQKTILPFIPDSWTSKINLGLDLQGGSQLDYKIDLRKVPEADQESIIEGVKEVIEKRVNSLGVAEPNIYVADLAGEKHIVVEIAETAEVSQEDADTYLGEKKEVKDLTAEEKKLVALEKAKATVGKTIQLEFKEEKGEPDPAEKEKVTALAQEALDKINKGADYNVIGQEEEQAYPGKVTYTKSDYVFESEIPESIREALLGLKKGEHTNKLVEAGGTFTIDETGQAIEATGLAILKLVDVKEETKNEKEVSVSHILVSYKGAERAEETVTRTKDEAEKLAKEIKTKLAKGEEFATLAKEFSDDVSNKDKGGKLDKSVTGAGDYVYDFEQAALKLAKNGDISEPVPTEFGFHVIKADNVVTDSKEKKYKYESISYSTLQDPWKETGLTGKNFVHADVQLDQFYQPFVQIQFDDEGAKLFEQLTEKNVGKRIAIFVGGELISAPNVNEKIAGGTAQISGQFTTEEAKSLARDLNTGAIPAPIILTGEYTIGATLGQEALDLSLLAGVMGFVLLVIFMGVFYRISGLVANFALATYAAILIFLIKAQLSLPLALLISLAVFIFIVSKTLNNKDSGSEKFITFILCCFAFFFLTFLLNSGVVLTLAGIAGIIMSMGVAVDTNVLIFERFKEEIKEGKNFSTALENGFSRAWDAIRDSNFSTLITCAILFFFGSSIIKGFAFNLAAGILVSMFTAIIVTRTLMRGFVGTKIAQNHYAFGLPKDKKELKTIRFTSKSKLYLTIASGLSALSLILILAFGLNLGIDFKGGTLLEFKFDSPVTKEQLASTLTDIEKTLKENPESVKVEEPASEPQTETETATTESVPAATNIKEDQLQSVEQESEIDLARAHIVESGENGFIIKTKYLNNEDHEKILTLMKDKLPKFSELRFTSIGPVIGKSLLNKAIVAIIFAVIMMIIYIAFAFRRIPKEVSPWRFGVTAIVALVHDILIVTGIFAVLGYFFNVEIDALFITAMLTVFGYSVNDTIIIFDRIRENLLRSRDKSLAQITDESLTQTLVRSINTPLLTLLALVAVLIWGSPAIFYFVLALCLGILIGTYSSIFVAGPLLVVWNDWSKKRK